MASYLEMLNNEKSVAIQMWQKLYLKKLADIFNVGLIVHMHT